jgi:hypothetical protein
MKSFVRGDMMDTILIVAAIAGIVLVAAGLHSRYLQARLKHVRGRAMPHYRSRNRYTH